MHLYSGRCRCRGCRRRKDVFLLVSHCESSIMTLRTSHTAEFSRHLVLSGGTQPLALSY